MISFYLLRVYIRTEARGHAMLPGFSDNQTAALTTDVKNPLTISYGVGRPDK